MSNEMDKVIDLTKDDSTGADLGLVNEISDEDDEDLKLAIALSLQDQKLNSPPIVTSPPLSSSQQPEPPAETRSSLLGLDRKAMEAERLARLKRKRNDVEDAPGVDIEHSSTNKRRLPPSPQQRQGICPPSTTTPSSFIQAQSKHRPQDRADSAFNFPQGRVLLIATPSRFSSTGSLEAISFPNILKPPLSASSSSSPYTLKSALLSSFITDFDWLFPQFDTSGPASVKFVLVLHAHDTRHRQLLRADFEGVKSVRLVMPEIAAGGFGTMHSKLMLLFFATKEDESKVATTAKQEICRLVVPSANLVPYDWGVGGVMENVLYVIDLPLKQPRQLDRNSDLMAVQETQFEIHLRTLLSAMGVPLDVLRKLSDFDFNATRDVGFVHTISGSTPLLSNPLTSSGAVSPTPTTTGLLSLSETIASLGLSIPPTSPAYPPQVDFITSSLGNLSIAFLRQLHQAVCGRLDPANPPAPSTAKHGGATKKKEPGNNEKQSDFDQVIRRNLRIYFPSAKTVRTSKGGEASAGTICFQKKWWDENELIRERMRDCVGVRGDGILMHSKILYVSFRQPLAVEAADGTMKLCSGWAYVGSANFSESAWGRITNDAKSKASKMTARNWETGIVLLVFTDSSSPLETSDNNSITHARDPPQVSGLTSSVLVHSTPTSAGERSNTKENGAGNDASLDTPMSSRKEGERNSASGNACTTSGRMKSRHAIGIGAIENDIRLAPERRHTLQVNDVSNQNLSAISETFVGRVPIPLQMPAPKLAAVGLQPWFFKG